MSIAGSVCDARYRSKNKIKVKGRMKRNRVTLEHEAQLEREARVAEWIELVSQYVRNAPLELARIVEAPTPLIVSFEMCFLAQDDGGGLVYIHQCGRDLFWSVTGDPYPVDDRSLWPWTSTYGDVRVWGTPDIITCIASWLGPRHKIAMAQACRAFRRVIVPGAHIWKRDVTAWPGRIECMPYLFFCRLKAFVDSPRVEFKHVSRQLFKAFFALLIMPVVSPDIITEESSSKLIIYSFYTNKPNMRFVLHKRDKIARLSIRKEGTLVDIVTDIRTSDIRKCIEWHLQTKDDCDYKTYLMNHVASCMKPKPHAWLDLLNGK